LPFTRFCGFSQPPPNPDFVKLKASIQIIDSQYILITNMTISKKESIEIKRDRFYDIGDCENIHAGKLYLRKAVRNMYVGIITDALRHPVYSPGFDSLIKISDTNTISDTTYLDNIYPLEIGEYKLMVELEYYYKKKKYRAQSSFVEFQVRYLPKN
jgi:hypothetical protein